MLAPWDLRSRNILRCDGVSNESFNLKISQIHVLHPPLIHNIHEGIHVATLLRPHHHLPYQGSAKGNGSGKSFMTDISATCNLQPHLQKITNATKRRLRWITLNFQALFFFPRLASWPPITVWVFFDFLRHCSCSSLWDRIFGKETHHL